MTLFKLAFSRQEYLSGLPFPSPGVVLPNTGIKPTSLCFLYWLAGSLPLIPHGKPQFYADVSNK